MLLYYITDRKQFPGTEKDQRQLLLGRISDAATAGVDYIQLREKDLSARELERLAREVLNIIRDHGDKTRLLINSRMDVALAVEADGVHLTATDISPADARSIWASSSRESNRPKRPGSFLIGVSCHSPEEVRLAESHGADFVVLAPIFEKAGANTLPLGLEALRRAARQNDLPVTRVEAGDQRARIPIFALGGVTPANAHACVRAGVSGIAGIRIFQQGDIAETVTTLRQII